MMTLKRRNTHPEFDLAGRQGSEMASMIYWRKEREMASTNNFARYEDYLGFNKNKLGFTYPASEDGEKCEFMNYTFTRKGEVYSPSGNLLKQSTFGNSLGQSVSIILYDKNNKKRVVHISVARAIYSMFSGESISRDFVVLPKNGDYSDCSYENLKLMSLSEYMIIKGVNKGKGRKRKYSNETIDAITNHYYHVSRDLDEICEKFNCSKTAIHLMIKGRYRKSSETHG